MAIGLVFSKRSVRAGGLQYALRGRRREALP
jgi:hypothetical protein